MAIKQAQYKLTLQSGEDIYHFQTDDKMVQIVDDNKNVIGTFKEYGMEGKLVTSGSFKNLKVTGLYQVRGVTGLPAGVPLDKISILSVKAVGKVGNPTLVSYDLITQSGEVYHNTALGATDVGWSFGGTSLKNAVTTLTNQVGSLASLRTTAKGSLVNAVNELKTGFDSTKTTLDELNTDYATFKTHDHDLRYINKSGDDVNGDLIVANNKRIRGKQTTGTVVNLIGLDGSNNVAIGHTGLKSNLVGSELNFNGKKVWHEGNDGVGSGLDADKLGGVPHADYAKTDRETRFAGNLISDRSLYARNSMYFGVNYDSRIGGIQVSDGGDMKLFNGKTAYNEIRNDGTLQGRRAFELIASSREVSLRFKLNDGDGGIGLYRNGTDKNLGFYNWQTGKRVGHIGATTNAFHFEESIYIDGRRLFLQASTPTGSIPAGSIWIS